MAKIIGGDGIGGSLPFGNEPSEVAQLGRIGGKLLNADLLRNGVDLSFRNGASDEDILYIDVTNNRIGVNTDAPTESLDIDGFLFIGNNLTAVGTNAVLGNIVINSTNTWSSTVGPIEIAPSGPDAFIEYGDVTAANIRLKDNFIEATDIDGNLQLDSIGTGVVTLLNNTDITGNLSVSQNIRSQNNVTLAGQFIIGDSPIDTVTINTDFTQDVLPGADDLYDLGSSDKTWRTVFLDGSIFTDNTNIQQLLISNQVSFSSNTITSILSNDTLLINPATGIIELESLQVQSNNITNMLDSPLVLENTGIGYVKFTDDNAIRIPVGDNSQRPFGEIGETRWNTEEGYLECFDGNVYQVATGGGVVVTPEFMQELGELYSLILG
jgi:hypothetical protein